MQSKGAPATKYLPTGVDQAKRGASRILRRSLKVVELILLLNCNVIGVMYSNGGVPREGVSITFERGAGLNYSVKFLGGFRVMVKCFRCGWVRGLRGVRVGALVISKVMKIRARAPANPLLNQPLFGG